MKQLLYDLNPIKLSYRVLKVSVVTHYIKIKHFSIIL